MTFIQLAYVLHTLTVVYWMNGQRQGRNLPPWPKKYPLVGSLLSIPSTLQWEAFARWGQTVYTDKSCGQITQSQHILIWVSCICKHYVFCHPYDRVKT